MKYIRFLLFPFSAIYYIVTAIRNFLFDVRFFKSTSFKIPVIVVGNLSVGGTGKTPQIEYLIRLLKNNFKLGILSRGYGRKTKGFILLNDRHSADKVGDEPLQYFKKFSNISVAVDENRVEGIQQLIDLKSSEVILLDDAYQHRKVKGSFYILLTKYNDLFMDDFLLPTGNLRESSSGANRADVIIVTKCPVNLDTSQQTIIKNKLSVYKKDIFFTSISYAKTTSGSQELLITDLKNYEVLLITGIANPLPFLDFLREKEINFEHLKFSDHHHFSKSEIDDIQFKFDKMKSKNKIILTTEKDYVRLYNQIKNLSFIAIETQFLNNSNGVFNEKIMNHIGKN